MGLQDIEKYWDAMKELHGFTRIWEQDGETLPIDKRLGLGQAAGLIKSDVLQTHPGKEKAGVKTGALMLTLRGQIHCQMLTAQGAPPRSIL